MFGSKGRKVTLVLFSPSQRTLSRSIGDKLETGESEITRSARNGGKGEERKQASPFSLFPAVPRTKFSPFPMGLGTIHSGMRLSLLTETHIGTAVGLKRLLA